MIKAKHITRIAYKQQPEKGDPGAKGAIRRVSEWAGGVQYYAGKAGEEYQDIVYYQGYYYLCTNTHKSNSMADPAKQVAGGSINWALQNDFNFIASKVVMIGEGTNGWIIDNGRIYHSSGKIELSSDGAIMTSNGNFIVDADGNLTAVSGTFSGILRARFSILNGAVTLEDQMNILGGGYLTLTLPVNDEAFAGRRLFVVDRNFPPYTKTSLGMYTEITVPNGSFLRGLGEYQGENTQAFSHISIRGGSIELLALPNYAGGGVIWMVTAGHENIIDKY